MQALNYKGGRVIDHTPVAAVAAGDVVVVGTLAAIAERPIAAGQQGALAIEGTFQFQKNDDEFSAGDDVYWDPLGEPVGGAAGDGCAQLSAIGSSTDDTVLLGLCVADAATTDERVAVKLIPLPAATLVDTT